VWAIYLDQFYASKASIIHKELGKGSVSSMGTDCNNKSEKDILKKVCTTEGISINEQPKGVMVYWRNDFWIPVNYSTV